MFKLHVFYRNLISLARNLPSPKKAAFRMNVFRIAFSFPTLEFCSSGFSLNRTHKYEDTSTNLRGGKKIEGKENSPRKQERRQAVGGPRCSKPQTISLQGAHEIPAIIECFL